MRTQRGFTLVETLLALLVVAVIGFGSYYVWHNHHKPPVKFSTSSSSSTPASTQKYFTITEWGVRAPYSGNLGLEYSSPKTDSAGLTYILTSSSQLDSSDSNCPNGGYGGAVNRYFSSAHFLQGDAETDSGQTAAAYAATLSASDYGHVGNYYYFYSHPQAACGSSQSSLDLQTQTEDAIKAALPQLQAVSQ